MTNVYARPCFQKVSHNAKKMYDHFLLSRLSLKNTQHCTFTKVVSSSLPSWKESENLPFSEMWWFSFHTVSTKIRQSVLELMFWYHHHLECPPHKYSCNKPHGTAFKIAYMYKRFLPFGVINRLYEVWRARKIF